MRTDGRVLAGVLLLATVIARPAGAEEFDIKRFSTAGEGWFKTFYVDDTQSLRSALDTGTVNAEMLVLVLETGTVKLALLADQMTFHHIAEGTAGGRNWMATF